MLNPTGLTLGEDGGSQTFTVALNAPPQSQVVLTFTSSDTQEVTVSPSTLTFEPNNDNNLLWSTAQTVTVTGVNDNTLGNDTATITVAVNDLASDNDFDGLSEDVTLTLTDDDQAALVVNPETITISENAGSNTFTVTLGSQPASDVVLEVATANTDEATVTPTVLTFTSTTWDTAQTVTITGVDDTLIRDDSVVTTVTVIDASSDDEFDTLEEEVLITLTDDDQDSDNDGVSDAQETLDNTDPNNGNDYVDTDGDGHPDQVETIAGSDPDESNSTPTDSDSDGVPDVVEDQQGSNPNDGSDVVDSDNDGIPDYVETREGTDSTDGNDYLDTDNDGVPDYVESNEGSDPNDATSYPDTDEDGVPDYVELQVGTDPNDASQYVDTDNDRVPDYVEARARTDVNDGTNYPDTDGDGVPDYQEEIDGTDSNNSQSFVDSDEGGVADYIESILFPRTGLPATNPNDPNDDTRDTDQDGVPDYIEVTTGTDPNDADSTPVDTDQDGVPDSVEIRQGTDPNDPRSRRDSDGDGVPDYLEDIEGTDKNDPNSTLTDSDNDGVPDVVEVIQGTDPNDALSFQDSDNGGKPDYVEIAEGSDPNNALDDPDADLDGIPDVEEQNAPNGGDANGDGIADYLQTNVASKPNPDTGAFATLEAQGECDFVNGYEIITEASLAVQDENGDYLVGLHDFELNCDGAGGSAEVTIIWDQVYDTSDWIYKKYLNNTYLDISSFVSFDTRVIGGVEKTISTYELTDGGDLDADGEVNGVIVDPAGPAVRVGFATTPVGRLLRTGGQAVSVARQNPFPTLLILLGSLWLFYTGLEYKKKAKAKVK